MNEYGHLLSLAEVAERLRVSRSWVSRARREGRFAPEIQLGKRVVIAETALADWLAGQVGQPEAA